MVLKYLPVLLECLFCAIFGSLSKPTCATLLYLCVTVDMHIIVYEYEMTVYLKGVGCLSYLQTHMQNPWPNDISLAFLLVFDSGIISTFLNSVYSLTFHVCSFVWVYYCVHYYVHSSMKMLMGGMTHAMRVYS